MPLAQHEGRRLRILFVVTEDWYFWVHWANLAKAVQDAGFDVLVATRVREHGERITAEGFHLLPLTLSRRSLNPLREVFAVLELARLYRRERPDLIHHVALKPIFYGSIAARLSGIGAVVNAFPGLGSIFI